MDRRHLYIGAIVVATLVTYSNSLKGEFVFDDSNAILNNPFLTRLSPLADAFRAPPRTTNSGRPIACFSLALKQLDAARAAFQTALTCDPRNTEAARELRRFQP